MNAIDLDIATATAFCQAARLFGALRAENWGHSGDAQDQEEYRDMFLAWLTTPAAATPLVLREAALECVVTHSLSLLAHIKTAPSEHRQACVDKAFDFAGKNSLEEFYGQTLQAMDRAQNKVLFRVAQRPSP